MLYICIFSNKFDLNQATSVSHTKKYSFYLTETTNDVEKCNGGGEKVHKAKFN